MRPVRTLLFLALVCVGHSSSPDAVAKDDSGQAFARLSVTVKDRSGKRAILPTPFTILPGEKRAAIYVPESGGILLLEGDQVRHHFPIPVVPADASSAVDDLDATDRLLVGGRWTPGDQITVELYVFDLKSGRLLELVESRNPRLGGEVNDRARLLWRVVVEGDTAGVYDPRLGATVPLWIRGTGAVPSADQIAHMRAGIGFGGAARLLPSADGSIAIARGGKTQAVESGDAIDFVDAVPATDATSSAPLRFVALDAGAPGAKPGILVARIEAVDDAGRMQLERRLEVLVAARDLELSPRWMHGPPVRLGADTLYYPYLGRDFLEVRRTPLGPASAPPETRP